MEILISIIEALLGLNNKKPKRPTTKNFKNRNWR